MIFGLLSDLTITLGLGMVSCLSSLFSELVVADWELRLEDWQISATGTVFATGSVSSVKHTLSLTPSCCSVFFLVPFLAHVNDIRTAFRVLFSNFFRVIFTIMRSHSCYYRANEWFVLLQSSINSDQFYSVKTFLNETEFLGTAGYLNELFSIDT